MNNTYCSASLSRPKVISLLVTVPSVVSARGVQAQTADMYTANPPFGNNEENVPAGSASSFAAVDASGVGAMYQTGYYRSYTDAESGKTLGWGGALHAIFMDESGRFREDNGIKGKLEDPNVDYVIDIFNDENVFPARTRFRRFQQIGSGKDAILKPVGPNEDMASLHTVWNARDALAGIPREDLLAQRRLDSASGNFAEDAGGKRFIFTWLDVPGLATTGKVDAGEVAAFSAAAFDPVLNDNWRQLGLASQNDAMALVGYVRGYDVGGWRSRLIDLPGDDTADEKYWILGDIVNSAPLVVNPPDERYDLVYGDATYKGFKEQYAHRRQMIYAGANDGMLHAFNGGIWDAASRSFQTQAYPDLNTAVRGQAHQLGAEMWAYVPMNLLPHLQWLKAEKYIHVYYVDGSPQSFDVNIFADDVTHPEGWGTILVTGMRFGGGDFALDLDADGVVETTRSSAFIVMDITDPEKPPVLLAELSSAELNFTTGVPALVKARRPDATGDYANPAQNSWLLVLGSGPEDLATATTNRRVPSLLAWDLRAGKYIDLPAKLRSPATEPPGFYGSFAVVDRNNDFVDDALYVGTVEGTEHAPAGRLRSLMLDTSEADFGLADGTVELSTLLDVAKPIVAAPAFIHDYAKGENWLLFGTGRFYTLEDYASASQQGLIGVKDTQDLVASPVALDSLVDATNILVQSDAASSSLNVWDTRVGNSLLIDDTRLATFDDLSTLMDNRNGWYKGLQAGSQGPAERVVNEVVPLRSSALFTSFLPGAKAAERRGESFIYALNYRTGTADAMGLLGTDQPGVVIAATSGGAAELAAPAVHIGQGNDPKPRHDSSNQHADDSDSSHRDSDTSVSLVVGDNDSASSSVELQIHPAVLRHISWELLDTSF